ncbi:hypothetical protein T492DRAFT_864177, partial [Pavlovales sp. CCMP2436]
MGGAGPRLCAPIDARPRARAGSQVPLVHFVPVLGAELLPAAGARALDGVGEEYVIAHERAAS